jgi:hypothetical protein
MNLRDHTRQINYGRTIRTIRIREALPGCKMLLHTGQAVAAADLLDSARAQGYILDLIAKPIHPAKLLEQLESMIPTEPPPDT